MNQVKKISNGKLLAYIGIPILLLAVALRFIISYVKHDGFSGLPAALPLFTAGILIFALLMSAFFTAWVYQDCKRRNDDGILWAVIVFFTTPFIGLLVYFLRRPEIKTRCYACGHLISLTANYCEECGLKTDKKEDPSMMELRRTHHMNLIVMGIICMMIMLGCLTSFIFTTVSGNGIHTDVTSKDAVWNMGSIQKNYEACLNGVWTLDFIKASDGFIAQEKLTVHNPDENYLYADITCDTVPENASLTLYLVQDKVVNFFDVTDLSEPFKFPLTDYHNGKVYVRLLIDGVENTVSKIYIQ